MVPTAGAADHHLLADAGGARLSERQRWQVYAGQCLHQPEARLLVIAEYVTGCRLPVAEREPNLIGLRDQITDGEHHAVLANEDAVAGTLGPKRLGRERVRRNDR